ncbi:MAG: hypothetical protein Q8M02_00865 [Candidatus Didemnitutus sp.]|nr:hypothetical protein [Candidatus Didemnitutus sp.]
MLVAHPFRSSAILLAMIGEQCGFRSTWVTDGHAAQSHLVTARAEDRPYTVLLVDVGLLRLDALQPNADESVIVLLPDVLARPAVMAGWPIRGVLFGSPSPHAIMACLLPFRR